MTEQIAVIGMSCRAPGAATYAALWSVLLEGRIAVGRWPHWRRRLSEVWSRDAAADVGVLERLERVMAGGYLDDVAGFDAGLFGISTREASAIDPQHRLLLEAAWSALQDAAIDPRSLTGTRTGVYVGLSSVDYALIGHEAGAKAGPYAALGSSKSLAANRISHVLGLGGPSMGVDAACSSTLVCVHLAARALAAGDCDLAVAGGANLILTPSVSMAFGKARMLSPTGRCHSFQIAADGYVRSEGAGAVVLKRLADAVRDGDPVHAVILGSAVNQDGRTPGITVPSQTAQVDVIRRAWDEARVGADDIDAIEAHGTGTPVGDSVELRALASVLRHRSRMRAPCLVGSLKANIGHTEAAAGLFSLVKAVGVLQTGVVPPHAADGDLLAVPSEAEGSLVFPLQASRLERACDEGMRVAVSAFGFGGTNCHMVLRRPPARKDAGADERRPVLVTLSAGSSDSLSRMVKDWARQFDKASERELASTALTSNAAYAGEAERCWAVASTPAAAAAELRVLTLTNAEQPNAALRTVIGLFRADGLSEGSLDLFGSAARGQVESIRGEQGAWCADLAAQVLLADLARRALPALEVVSFGAEPLAGEVLFGSRLLEDALAAIRAGRVKVSGPLPGEDAARGAETLDVAALDAAVRVIAIGTPPQPLQKVAETVALTTEAGGALRAFGALWACGVPLALEVLAAPETRRMNGLPAYPFNHVAYWFSHLDCPGIEAQAAAFDDPVTLEISLRGMDYLRDHRIGAAIIAPGATLVDVALSHASSRFGAAEWVVQDVAFHGPVILDEELGPPVMLSLTPRRRGAAAEAVAFEFWRSCGEGQGGAQRLAAGVLGMPGDGTS